MLEKWNLPPLNEIESSKYTFSAQLICDVAIFQIPCQAYYTKIELYFANSLKSMLKGLISVVPLLFFPHFGKNFFHCSDEAKKILEVLEHLGYSPTLNELQIVKDVCDMISMRSARLAAAGLATIIKVILLIIIIL